MSDVTYKTANAVPTSGPSPIIWADCPVVTMIKDPGKGVHIFEDFIAKRVDLAAAGQYGMFEVVEDGDGVACVDDTAAYDNEHGVAVLTPTGSSAYDEAYFVSPVLYQLKMNSRKKFWLETRIKLSDVTDDMSLIFGLTEAATLAGAAVIEEGASPDQILDNDFIGFVAFTDGSAVHDIDCIYQEDGDGAVTQVKDAARAAASWVNDTYVKLGMRFDGEKTVTFYIDGVAITPVLDIDDFATNTANQLDPLGLILGKMDHDTSASSLSVDWIRFAFER